MKSTNEIDWTHKKGLLLDWDGTLMDTVGAWAGADAAVLRHFLGIERDPISVHAETQKFLQDHSGTGDPYLAHAQHMFIDTYGVSGISAEDLATWRLVKANEILQNTGYKPGAAAILNQAISRGLRLGLVTGTSDRQFDIYKHDCPKLRAEAPVDELFDVVITADIVTKRKPDPEPYLAAIAGIGGTPDDHLAFEDTLIGVLSAKAAGLEVVWVYDSYSVSEHAEIAKIADYHLRDWRELHF